MKRILITSVVTLILFNLTLAQKRTTILGDAWTGEVTATDDNNREITIQYEEKGKKETFTGVLTEGYQVKLQDGSSRALKVSEIPKGTRIRVFYKRKEREIGGGRKLRINLISHIVFLGRDEFSRLRESLKLDPSVTVSFADSENLPTAAPLKMYLAVDLPHIKYRFGEWVIKWNKKHAVKYGFLEIVQDLAQADAALVVYRGSDTLNIALPLDLYDSAGNSYSATISKATAYLVIKGDGGLKVLWSKVMLVATTEESEGSKPLIEKEIEKRMKARSKK